MANSNETRIVIAGGSGFLGLSLAESLHKNGVQVTLLSRNRPSSASDAHHVQWDGRSDGEWRQCLSGADGLVNLAGRSVDCMKTPDHRDEIYRSRVESTRALGRAVRTVDSPPPVWVQMSTAHIYGDPPTAVCTEGSEFGTGLAPDVGKAWEHAFQESVLPEQRSVILRTGFVLGRDRGAGAGALGKLGRLARIGLGGTVGSGNQGMSWIHEADMNGLFKGALFDKSMSGIYIASAPNPVSQKQFMKDLRSAVGMPFGLPAYEWMVRIAAPLILRTDPELALYGRYVKSARLEADGFPFAFAHLPAAFKDLFGPATESRCSQQ
ncbi:MAG: DUF1731 domain-containing protein [Fuerstiella sp.]